jgi:DNA topoisomerase-3
MREIVAMTERIVGQAKGYESDTIPGDFATLSNPCPKCGTGEVHEKYKKFQCTNPDCDFAFWKILGGRQLEPHEADALIKDREIGPLEGFRSKMGRPFSAKLKLTDGNEVTFDFGNDNGTDDGEAPDFSAQAPLGVCPKCASNVFELPNAYVCEKAVGRMILQRPIERVQMEKLLATKKTDLLQFVSARTRRPFSAFLVVQKDGKVGFEFEAKDPTKARARGGRPTTALKVLGAHPRTKAPVELHSGKYGPYVKHGAVNATLPDSEKAETLTLEEALELLAAKAGKSGGSKTGGGKIKRATKPPVKKAAKTVAAIPTAKPTAKRPSAKTAAKKPVAKKPAAKKPAAKKTSRT